MYTENYLEKSQTFYQNVNKHPKGRIYLVAPGLLNPESTKGFLHHHKTCQFVYISPDVFINHKGLKALVNQGCQVIVPFDSSVIYNLDINKIDYVVVYPNPVIISEIGEILMNHYNSMETTYNDWYMDENCIKHIISEMMNKEKRLEILNPNFDLVAAINEYDFYDKDVLRHC